MCLTENAPTAQIEFHTQVIKRIILCTGIFVCPAKGIRTPNQGTSGPLPFAQAIHDASQRELTTQGVQPFLSLRVHVHSNMILHGQAEIWKLLHFIN